MAFLAFAFPLYGSEKATENVIGKAFLSKLCPLPDDLEVLSSHPSGSDISSLDLSKENSETDLEETLETSEETSEEEKLLEKATNEAQQLSSFQ